MTYAIFICSALRCLPFEGWAAGAYPTLGACEARIVMYAPSLPLVCWRPER